MQENDRGNMYHFITANYSSVTEIHNVPRQKCKLILSLPFKDENIRFSLQFFSVFFLR